MQLNGFSYRLFRFLPFSQVFVAALFVLSFLVCEPLHADSRKAFSQHVELSISVSGELRLNSSGKGVQKVPLTASAVVAYDELSLSEVSAGRWLRRYSKASSEARPGSGRVQLVLRPQRDVVFCDVEDRKAVLASPLGPLTRDELDILDVQFNSSLLHDEVLPLAREVGPGKTLDLANELLAALLGLDVVLEQDLEATLTEEKGGLAGVRIHGQLEGLAGGVSSKVNIEGEIRCAADFGSVRQLSLKIEEERSIGHASPGFKLVANLRGALGQSGKRFIAESRSLAKEFGPQERQELLEHKSAIGGLSFLHARGWHVLADRHDVTILRYVDGSDLIAQANISRLPAMAKGKHLSLETFQESVKSSLGERFGQFVEAKQAEFGKGGRLLRVVVLGESANLPVQWNYVHASRADGERCSMVFTHESSLAGRFASADAPIVSSLVILDRDTGAPTRANAEARSADLRGSDKSEGQD